MTDYVIAKNSQRLSSYFKFDFCKCLKLFTKLIDTIVFQVIILLSGAKLSWVVLSFQFKLNKRPKVSMGSKKFSLSRYYISHSRIKVNALLLHMT